MKKHLLFSLALICLVSCDSSNQVQMGTVSVTDFDAIEVIYPNPYAAAPSLTVDYEGGGYTLESQTAEGFKFVACNSFKGGSKFHWRAVGRKRAN